MNDYSKLNKVSLEIRNQVEEREHFHQDIELIYILDGSMIVEAGDQKSELKAEDILVINANKRHWLQTDDKNILYLRLGIAYQLVSDVFQSVDIIFWCDSSKENDKRYEEVRKVLKELLGQYLKWGKTEVSFGYISICYKVLDIMALHFLVQTGDKENITDKDRFEERIFQINNYIRSNYAQNISLKDLSEKLYLSIGYLSRFFKKNYGMSFAEYLTNIRLYHAVDDLLYTNVPITHVAYNNGFTNAAVFNKAFKKAYGETPSFFRKKAVSENGQTEQKGYDKETERRVFNILEDGAEEADGREESEYIEVRESVKLEQKLSPIWNKMINIGSAGDLLRSEIREHVILLKEALGIEYVRFWNIFSDNMLLSLSEEGEYNFTRLDSILDFLLQNDIRPHIELGAKPKYIQKNVQVRIWNSNKKQVDPEMDVWKKFMKAFMKHLILRYGQESTNTWRMELWWDESIPRNEESRKRYIQMFGETWQIIKSYSPRMEVGGYGLRGDFLEEDDILDIWGKEKIKPDFVSAVIYAYIRGTEKEQVFSKRNTDTEALKNAVLFVREHMDRAGMKDTKLYITEWNLTISDRNYINDTCFKGAYIIKNYLDFYGLADMAAYYTGSDRMSEHYDSNELLFGGRGVLSKDGILKPAGFAFEFLNRLYPYFVGKGENYLISSDGHGSYGIICHNMRRLNYNYYFTKEDELEKDQMWKYIEDQKQLNLKVILDDLESGEYQQKIYRINSNNGNVLGVWGEMGYIRDMDREDVKYFRRVCEPKMLIDNRDVVRHQIEVDLTMEPNEITFVRIRKIG